MKGSKFIMTDATEKQIEYAKRLGIENPESYTKAALSEMIDKKLAARKPKEIDVKELTFEGEPMRTSAQTDRQAGIAMRFAVDLAVAGKIKLEQIESIAEALLGQMRRLAK